MILEDDLAAIIAKQHEMEDRKSVGQARPLDFNDVLLDSHVLDITGVRRCGKSTVMRQRMRGAKDPWFYVNFESPLLTQFEMRDTIRLDSLIDAYADLPEVAEVAIDRYNYMSRNTDATLGQRWDYLNMAIDRWGSWPRIKQLENARNQLKTSQFSVLGEGTVLPGKPFPVSLKSLRNISSLTMRVYRVNAKASDLSDIFVNDKRGYERIKSKLTALPDLTQTRTYEGKKPYEYFEDSLTLAALPVGIYML